MKAELRLCLHSSLVLLVAATLSAASFVVPTDALLIDSADAIVIATALRSYPEPNDLVGITTVTEFRIERLLKQGALDPNGPLYVTELGGELGDERVLVDGSPRFNNGERVVLFLERTQRGTWRTHNMILGKFSFVQADSGHRLLVRALAEGDGVWDATGLIHQEVLRLESGFVEYIERRARGEEAGPDYFVQLPKPITDQLKIAIMQTRTDYLLLSGGMGFRWPNPTVSYRRSGDVPGLNAAGAITAGAGMWNGEPTSNVALSLSGTPAGSTNTASANGENAVIYNDPNGVVSGSFGPGGGTLGIGIARSSGTHMVGAETFFSIVEGDVVMNDGINGATPGHTQTLLNAGLGHELGHTIGMRHSDETGRVPQSNNALMRSSLPSPIPTGLLAYDIGAVSTVYGSGGPPPPCTPPSISTQPQSQAIPSGTSANLSVAASGTTPITFAWFSGPSGNTSSGVLGTGSSFNTGVLTSTTQFWARATGQCAPTADSAAATITVTPVVCTPVSIIQQPQNRSIEAGTSTALSVTAGGTAPFTYQWFIGTPGNTSNPVPGGTTQQIFVSPATTTTYWVRVGGCNSSTINSAAATVTVSPCVPPNITSQPQNVTVQSGQTATLVVSAQGTNLNIDWYRGNRGDIGSGVLGNGASFTTPALTESTRFWARLTNNCGTRDSEAALVTVAPACPAGRLCLLSGRFEVTASWRDPNGNTGSGSPVPLTSDSGYFTFFSAANIEVVLKVLNGCPVNGRFWVFAAGLTNVQVDLVVRDTQTGASKTYSNPLGTAFQPIQDTAAFQTCSGKLTAAEVDADLVQQTTEDLIGQLQAVNTALTFTDEVLLQTSDLYIDPFQGCTQDENTMCLAGNRFRVQATFAIPDGTGGTGKAVRLTDDSGYFWFFNPDNVEIVTKVLNACIPAFNRYWVFSAGLTNVQVNLTVTDTQTGAVKQYSNPQGTAYAPIQDTDAFATCP